MADWTHDPSYLQTQHAIHNLWSTPRMTTNLTSDQRARAMEIANGVRDAELGNRVDTIASFGYWHGVGQHGNGAVTDCAGCVRDDNTRGLSEEQIAKREALIAKYAPRAANIEREVESLIEVIGLNLTQATDDALEGANVDEGGSEWQATEAAIVREVRRTLGWL